MRGEGYMVAGSRILRFLYKLVQSDSGLQFFKIGLLRTPFEEMHERVPEKDENGIKST